MCTNPVTEQKAEDGCFDLISLKKFIKKEKKQGSAIDIVYITGGEPTIRPDFFEAVDYISKSVPSAKISLLSNGRRFFYPDFAKKYLSFGDVDLTIPIHGWDEKSHDAVTGARGSFSQTVAGLKNLLKLRQPGQQIEIRVIIHRINYKSLSKIFDFLLREFPFVERVVAIFMEYEGHAIKNLKLTRLNYKEFQPQFKLLGKYLAKFNELRFYHFPLCAMPKEFWPHMWRTIEKDEIIFPGKCSGCAVRESCLGIHRNYFELFGDKELKPIEESVLLVKSDNYHHPIIDVKRKKSKKN
jgi:MoaA/NifB/PqqE/SkfB family radical SAM enzyme